MRAWQIGIVGGGPGGLMTAYFLQKWADDPYRVTLFEAGHRLGGKILTPSFQTVAATYEAGAAEIYDYSHIDDDPLKELVAELGLPINRMDGCSAVVGNRPVANLDDLRDHLGEAAVQALLDFDRRAKDQITPQEFYATDPETAADAKKTRPANVTGAGGGGPGRVDVATEGDAMGKTAKGLEPTITRDRTPQRTACPRCDRPV